MAEREAFLEEVREALAIAPEYRKDSSCVVSWEEVQEMQESGWVSFGAHTMHHPVLAELSDPAEVDREVGESRTALQERLGKPIRTFAYPLGRTEHIGNEALKAVQKAGFSWALTTNRGVSSPQSQPYLLERLQFMVHWHWLLLAADMAGLAPIFDRVFPYGRALLGLGAKIKESSLRFAQQRSAN